MSLIGPISLKFGVDATDYGDYVTQIQQTAPAPIVQTGINRDFSETPDRGWAITLTGVDEGDTLWDYLWDNANTKDVTVTWSPDGEKTFTGVVTSIPAPSTGGQGNQHKTFNVTLPLKTKPTKTVPAPEVPEE